MNECRPRFQIVRVALHVLGWVAMITQLAGCSPRQHPPVASAQIDQASEVGSPAPVTPAAAPPHVNSQTILARCQPELTQSPQFVPTFEIDEHYNRAAVQLKVRFVVDGDGFVMNVYLAGANVVTPADQEAAIDYVRHLTFAAPDGDECKTVKMQMVGNFHMAKDSSGDWITVFEVHPVYSFSGDRVVVNPN